MSLTHEPMTHQGSGSDLVDCSAEVVALNAEIARLRAAMEGKVLVPLLLAESVLEHLNHKRFPIAASRLEQCISIAKGRNE